MKINRKSKIKSEFLNYKWGGFDLCQDGKLVQEEWESVIRDYGEQDESKWVTSFGELWNALCDYLEGKNKRERDIAEKDIRRIIQIKNDSEPFACSKFCNTVPDEVARLFDVFYFVQCRAKLSRKESYMQAYIFLSKPVKTYALSTETVYITAHSERDALKRLKKILRTEKTEYSVDCEERYMGIQFGTLYDT